MFLFMDVTEMMSEVEAIRDGWKGLHVCQRDWEKTRDFFPLFFFFFDHITFSTGHANAHWHTRLNCC